MSRIIRDCNVAVIGGAGFLGSHLVNHLIEDRNCHVLVLDNLITGRKEFIHPKAKFCWCDITHSEHYLYKNMFKGHNIDYVFNYAAEPYIPVSFKRPLHVFDINAFGALKVMSAAQDAGVKGILQVSSAEIYGEGTRHDNPTDPFSSKKIDELDHVCPHSSYGAAKAAIDAMIQVRWHEAQTPCIALRQFNCIGERETHPYVVPEIIGQLSKQQSPLMKDTQKKFDRCATGTIELGNNSFRDFQYAGDAVRMATELLEKGQFGEVYNMGSETGAKIYDLATMIGDIMGFANIVVIKDPKRIRPWEIWHLQSNNAKLYSVIETRPQLDLYEALKRTVEDFYRAGSKWSWQ